MTTTPRPQRTDARPKRVMRMVTVSRVEQVTRDLLRVHFTGDAVREIGPLQHADSYVKLLFAPAEADYAWPFDPDEVRETHPREQWPVTRTYTIRSLDADAGTMAIDFVVHGDTGLAGPWAASAKPGDSLGFLGPGGAWSPSDEAALTILVGDESAVPAIAAGLEAMKSDARAHAIIEVADETCEPPLRVMPGLEVTWVHRGDAAYGAGLVEAMRGAYARGLPEGRVDVFVHGNADMIRDARRLFVVELGVPREHASISGYWRSGLTEDRWQATKSEFVAQMEADEQRAS